MKHQLYQLNQLHKLEVRITGQYHHLNHIDNKKPLAEQSEKTNELLFTRSGSYHKARLTISNSIHQYQLKIYQQR